MDSRRLGPLLYVADYVSGRYMPVEKIVPRRSGLSHLSKTTLRDGPTKMAAPPPIGTGTRPTPIIKDPPRSMKLKQMDSLESMTRYMAKKFNDVSTRDLDRMSHDVRWQSVSSAATRNVRIPVKQKAENNEPLPHTDRFAVQRSEPYPQPWQTKRTDTSNQLRPTQPKVNFPYKPQLSQKEYSGAWQARTSTTYPKNELPRYYCPPYPGHTGYNPELVPANAFPPPRGPLDLGCKPTTMSTMQASYRAIPQGTERSYFAKEIPFSQWSQTTYPYKPFVE